MSSHAAKSGAQPCQRMARRLLPPARERNGGAKPGANFCGIFAAPIFFLARLAGRLARHPAAD